MDNNKFSRCTYSSVALIRLREKPSRFDLPGDSLPSLFSHFPGTVYFLDDRGKCKKCYQVEAPLKYVLYYENKDIIVTITDNLLLTQHNLQQDGEYNEISKVFTYWFIFSNYQICLNN
jgi:hypothetical protein